MIQIDMEMPKSCSACCLHVDGVCLLYDEYAEIKNWNKRLPKCPLQEVKE